MDEQPIPQPCSIRESAADFLHGGSRIPQAVNWGEQKQVAAVCHDLKPLLGLHGEPEWVRIDRHERALPLYHGNYRQRLSGISQQLQHLPGLHLAANYKGGVSVRDRILCGLHTAKQIRQQLTEQQSGKVSFPAHAEHYPGFCS